MHNGLRRFEAGTGRDIYVLYWHIWVLRCLVVRHMKYYEIIWWSGRGTTVKVEYGYGTRKAEILAYSAQTPYPTMAIVWATSLAGNALSESTLPC